MKQGDNYVIGIGEILWDILPNNKKLGGAPANFAYHVSQMGLNGCVVSAVGNDALGDEIIKDLKQRDLKCIIQRDNSPTGTVSVSVNESGIPQYVIHKNAAWDNIHYSQDINELAKHTKAVCFGTLAQRSTISRNTISNFIANIPEQNFPLIIFDINIRQKFYTSEIIRNSLNLCNILKINDEELNIVVDLLKLPKLPDVTTLCNRIIDEYNLNILILTCGINGSYIFTNSGSSFLETPKVNVIDTVGAGDAFTAAFVASLMKGYTIQIAHKVAVSVSAYVCTQKGAMPVLPNEYLI